MIVCVIYTNKRQCRFFCLALNFFVWYLMISRIFVLNVFCAVDKVSLFIINCMRFVFVLISVTSMKDIFDTIFTVKDAESNGISRQRL
jgi:hypothetical protein